ncbi:TRAP transporter permease, partial [Chloroflexota bacterium]
HVLYIAGVFIWFDIYIPRMVHQAASLSVFLGLFSFVYPSRKSKRVAWYDVILMLMGAAGCLYYVIFWDEVKTAYMSGLTPPHMQALFIMTAISLFEATRRCIGWPMPLIAVLFLLYCFIGNSMPGILHTRSFSLARVANYIFISRDGLFGIAMYVASTIIFIFVLFAQLLLASGAGKFFTDLSLSLLGSVRGGPAKVAVIASGFMGSLSGSPSTNVVTTGSVTIPLMKSIGYKPYFAAAVEAVASNGGMFMPPVMGGVAFLMAEWLEITYLQVCIAAVLPAILYYLALFVMVDLEAAKTGLHGLARRELPPFWQTMKQGGLFLVPLVVLVFTLAVLRYSPQTSGLYAILSMIVVSWFRKGNRVGPRILWQAFEATTRSMFLITLACATAGLIIGSVALSGLGIKLSGALVTLAHGNLLVLLALAAGACFVLGMGLPALPCYVMVSILVAPAIVGMGVPPIAAHMFVFLWAVTSFITPPVCTTSFVAAGMAGSHPMQTGWTAVRLGICTFIVPFIFVYNPVLLMMGTIGEIALAFPTALAGAALLACGVTGYAFKLANWWERITLSLAALLLMYPGWQTDIVGIGAAALILIRQFLAARATRAKQPPGSVPSSGV